MHGLEYWLGLVRAWIIIGVVVYGLWTFLDVIRALVLGVARSVSDPR